MNQPLVAVVGMGLLGRGIAACLLSRSVRVVGCDHSWASLQRARQAIAAAVDELVEQNAAPPTLRDEWEVIYEETTCLSRVSRATFVIESVTEDADVKARLFDELEKLIDERTPVASNTSAIPISTIQRLRKHPERFLGMHWAEPAHVTRFLELIRGEATSDQAFSAAIELAILCGKEPSMVQCDVPGFIANRLGYAMYREAFHLLEMGVADAETIDRAFRNSVGLWATFCGPLRWIDISGGPCFYAKAMEPVLPTLGSTPYLPAALKELADESAEGIRNGRGFYGYDSEEALEWEEGFRRHAWQIKHLVDQQRPLPHDRSP